MIHGSTTLGSAAAQALQSHMLYSPEGVESWLLNEIYCYNVHVKRRCFPKEASKALRETMDEVLSLALSLHKSSPLVFIAFALFALF
jgi:hypothetical protein